MKTLLISLSVFINLMLLSPSTLAIQKCQDADGNWHYGDIAVVECENSKITTLNDRGFITEEEAAPKTAEEIKADEERLAAETEEEARLRQEQEERLRILSIYETEEDIDRQRDNQMSSVQGNIDVHQSYLRGMEARIARYENQMLETKSERRKTELQDEIVQANARVEKSEQELAILLEQRAEIEQKFEREKELYNRLKNSE